MMLCESIYRPGAPQPADRTGPHALTGEASDPTGALTRDTLQLVNEANLCRRSVEAVWKNSSEECSSTLPGQTRVRNSPLRYAFKPSASNTASVTMFEADRGGRPPFTAPPVAYVK
jgi:hypothetical protein